MPAPKPMYQVHNTRTNTPVTGALPLAAARKALATCCHVNNAWHYTLVPVTTTTTKVGK